MWADECISDWQHVYVAALLLAWLIMFVFYQIQLVKQLHLFCLNTFLQSRALSVEFPEMMSEVIAAQLPKILAGMVKPLLFHKKWNVFSLITEMIPGSFFVCLFWSRFCNVRTSAYLTYLPCRLLYTCNIHKPFKLDVHIVSSWFLNCKNHNSHNKCFVNLSKLLFRYAYEWQWIDFPDF